MEASYVDGKGYKETALFRRVRSRRSRCRATSTRAPFIVRGNSSTASANTSAVVGQRVRLLLAVHLDLQRRPDRADAADLLRDLADGSSLATVGLSSRRFGVLAPPGGVGPGAGEFSAPAYRVQIEPLNTAGQIGVRVKATDPGGLSVTNTFFINVVPLNSPPVAVNDTYTAFKGTTLTALP